MASPKTRRQVTFFNQVLSVFRQRITVLVVLMLLQSASSSILSSYQKLLEKNVVVTLFLTMLVGAGGNAGNQSAVHVIRALAVNDPSTSNKVRLLGREILVGGMIAVIMCTVAFGRVLYTLSSINERSGEEDDEDIANEMFGTMGSFSVTATRQAAAIILSLFFIVTASMVFGTGLPLIFDRIGWDPAHAGPAIQVLMDVMGVYITCVCCSSILL